MKYKVYISKSNEANYDHLLMVRNLAGMHSSIKLLEHSGGPYNPSLVQEADIVLVIPGIKSIHNNKCIVGKGLYSEAKDNSYIFNGKHFNKLRHKQIIDETNWQKYAVFTLGDKEYTLLELLNNGENIQSDSDIDPLHLL